jgi:Flp pilus assembly protein TadG
MFLLLKRKRQARRSCRRGAAAVEFAIVAPVLIFGAVFPMIEFSRSMIISELVSNAARTGARTGAIPGASTAAITAAVNTAISTQNLTGATTSVQVNGGSGDASTAQRGDAISVTVSVPYNNNAWLPPAVSFFMGGTNISTIQVMRRE